MKIRICTNCKQYAEESDMEKIEGKYYCYFCFSYCNDCGKPFPTEKEAETTCLHCVEKNEN